jgi:MFS family permease
MKKPALSPALVIALISIPIFIGALDLTVVSAVLPQVTVDLQIPQTEISSAAWIVSGYLLAYTVAMTFMGRLSDLVGRRRVYLLALAIFALGSYLVAVADGWPTDLALRAYYIFFEGRPDPMRVKLYLLVAARMVQAFGGGAMVPVGMALAGDLYPAGQRARALGIIAAVDTSGWVVGHLYGGIIAYSFDWRVIFWLNLPVCLLGFLLIAWVLRRLPAPAQGGRMDWAGAALIALCLVMLNFGLGSTEAGGTFSSGGETGLPPYALPLIFIALILLGLFLWRQARTTQPLIPLSLFRRANFTVAGLENFLIGFCLFIAIAGVPLFINTLVAQSIRQGAWESGWMLSALTVPMALAAIPGGWLTARFGYRLPAFAGLALTIAGFLLMSGWRADAAGGTAALYLGMIPHLVLAGIGFGLTIAPLAAAAIDTAPSDYRGTASALVLVFRLIGMTLSATAIAAYGQQRFNQLSTDYLAAGRDLVTAGVEAITKVISETFLLSAAICALALLLTLLLKPFLPERNTP